MTTEVRVKSQTQFSENSLTLNVLKEPINPSLYMSGNSIIKYCLINAETHDYRG